MNRRSWDSASSHWSMSPQCASPQAATAEPSVPLPYRRNASPPHRGSPLLGSLHPRPSPRPPALRRTGPGHRTQPLCSHWHAFRCFQCAAVKRRRRREEGRGWFLRSCLVLEGRSQLLILRCKDEAPRGEVRDRLRNRNYYAFYPQTSQRRIYCAALFTLSLTSVRDIWRWRWMWIRSLLNMPLPAIAYWCPGQTSLLND